MWENDPFLRSIAGFGTMVALTVSVSAQNEKYIFKNVLKLQDVQLSVISVAFSYFHVS